MTQKQFDSIMEKAKELKEMGYSKNLIEQVFLEKGVNLSETMLEGFMSEK